MAPFSVPEGNRAAAKGTDPIPAGARFVIDWARSFPEGPRVDATLPALALNGIVADFGEETLRDPKGALVPLRPQAFAVLRCLAERPGRLVSKDELMAVVWPGIAVTDDSLVQAVGDVRRAIGDEAHKVIRTVPRRGYRLVPPAAEMGAGAAVRPRARPARLGAALAIAALVLAGALAGWQAFRPEPRREPAPAPAAAAADLRPVLAVVPFVYLADDEAARRLGELGKHFETRDLAGFPEYQLVMRGPDFLLRDRGADGLVVDYVLGGSVGRQGDRLRLTAELTDARSRQLLWSERWDRPDGDVAAMQEEVAEQIANRLGGATGLIQELGRRAAQAKQPSERTAWDRLLLASGRLTSGTRADTAEAATLLAEAVKIDPGLGHAEALRALAHLRLAEFGDDPAANLAAAREAARQAVFLDREDAWAYAALGASLRREGDLVRARSEYETALTLMPKAAEIMTQFAGWAATGGEPERGAALADRVARLDPDFPPAIAAELARAYFMAGRYRAALAMLARLPEEATTPTLAVLEAAALAAVGRSAEAAAATAAALAADPGLSIEAVTGAAGWGDGERRRLAETMRLAGFPACAALPAAAAAAAPQRLPECATGAQAGR
jgi:DNA-binding winged helix-turn-helix (wHTH) protein/TolB-like protein/Flp pilus assembly protein TadD